MNLFLRVSSVAMLATAALASRAAAPPPTCLSATLESIAQRSDGTLGACIATDADTMACVHGDDRFPLQSVVKLATAIVVLDRVDHGIWRLDDTVFLTKDDLSVFVQPIADKIGRSGSKVSMRELLDSLITESDSAANDFLLRRLGGTRVVQHFLEHAGLRGLRIDRDERHLQTEMIGLTWQADYVDASIFERAMAAVPDAVRGTAFDAYLRDERDTATPRGMTALLTKLQAGALLSADSTRYLLDLMQRTTILPGRLKAGTPNGWTLGHRTGTSLAWKGVTAATNDVGIMTSPMGDHLAVATFIKASAQSVERREALLADVARAAVGCWNAAQSSPPPESVTPDSSSKDGLRIK